MALNYDFPQELLDHILGFLWQDTPSLLSTSLVCRAWRAPSQRGLFFSFTTSLSDNTPQAEILQPFACLVFLKESPHLARYVRDLRIYSGINNTTGHASDILRLLSHLPCLKSLLLDAQSPPGIIPLVSAILQYLQQTDTLIHTVSLQALTLPPDILYLLPGSSITKLTVSDLQAGATGTSTIVHQIPRTPLHLEELHIGLYPKTAPALVATLQKLRSWLPHLRTIILTILIPSNSDVDAVLKILSTPETIPTSVSHFGLIYSVHGWALLHHPMLDLQLTEITDLTFGLEYENVGVDFHRWMAKTVNRWADVLHDLIPCPLGLRKVTLHFGWIEDPDVMDAWLLVDTALATLHIEEVAFFGSLWRDEDVYVAFPELVRKGVIRL